MHCKSLLGPVNSLPVAPNASDSCRVRPLISIRSDKSLLEIPEYGFENAFKVRSDQSQLTSRQSLSY